MGRHGLAMTFDRGCLLDIRDRASDMRWWSSEPDGFAVVDFEGKLVQIRYVVCNVCDGRGYYVNPSIDSNGIDPEEFDRDPSFREDYFSGMFDVRCELCWGSRVIPVPLYPDDLKRLSEWQEAGSDSRAIQEAEQRMGA